MSNQLSEQDKKAISETPPSNLTYERGCTPCIQVIDECPYYATTTTVPKESDESPTNT